jgi:hypothetical protein
VQCALGHDLPADQGEPQPRRCVTWPPTSAASRCTRCGT